MFSDITLKVVNFISNRFSEFIRERNPSRHVNVYRTRFILQLHHQVEVFAVVPLDDVAREWLLMSSYDPHQSDLRSTRDNILKVLVMGCEFSRTTISYLPLSIKWKRRILELPLIVHQFFLQKLYHLIKWNICLWIIERAIGTLLRHDIMDMNRDRIHQTQSVI